MIHDDSPFSVEATQAFVRDFLAKDPLNEVVGQGDCVVDVSMTPAPSPMRTNVTCRTGSTVVDRNGRPVGVRFPRNGLTETSAAKILRVTDQSGATITYLGTYQDTQRLIFGAVAREDILFGEGFGWLNNLPDPSAIMSETEGSVDINAARGLEGALGFIEFTPDYSDGGLVQLYLNNYWRPVDPSPTGCIFPATARPVPKSSFDPSMDFIFYFLTVAFSKL